LIYVVLGVAALLLLRNKDEEKEEKVEKVETKPPSLKFLLFNISFWHLFMVKYLTYVCVLYFDNNFKPIGLEYTSNDHLITLASSVG